MNSPTIPQATATASAVPDVPDTPVVPVDPDLAEQALPGHGVPSQDPDPAAQVPLTAEESDRESKSVLMGGGLVAGAATGAAVGAAVAGPVGVMVGGIIGSVVGTLGGSAVGAAADAGDTPRPLAPGKKE